MQESKKIIDICSLFGSPKKTGQSAGIHEAFITSAHAKNVRRFYAYAENINPCIGCGECAISSTCTWDDGMNEIYKTIRESDLIVISFPLYFSNMPGPLKNIFDRFQLLWEEKRRDEYPAKKQKAIIIATSGSSYDQIFSSSVRTVQHVCNSIDAKLDRENSVFCENLDTHQENYSTAVSQAIESAARLMKTSN